MRTQFVDAYRSLNVTVAAYNQGALLLADTLGEGRSRVILVSRDLTIPPVGGSSNSVPGLRELVCEVAPPVPGKLLGFLCQPMETFASVTGSSNSVPGVQELVYGVVAPLHANQCVVRLMLRRWF